MGKRVFKRAYASFFLPLIIALSLVITSTGVVYAAPSIVRVEPNYGTSRGGASVTIEGAGFAPDAVVLFGGHQAIVTGRDAGRIVCTVPPGLGNVPLEVINGDGSNDALSYQYTLSDSLYIDDHQTGSAGEEVHFSLGINNAPEDITSFGFDIHFDPNVLNPVSDPNKPDSIGVLFTRGELAADFKYLGITYTPGNSYLRVGGFTQDAPEEEQSFIPKGVSGVIATVHFTMLRELGTATLNIVGLDDDMAGWSARPGYLFSCPSEVCDGKDNDCDGITDEGCYPYYSDRDQDGFGDPNDVVESIIAPEGYVSNSDDCDDTDGTVHPEADEVCDGKDNDCNGVVPGSEIDDDGDEMSECQGDCDDTDSTVYLEAPEVCDGKDNDCDSAVPADEMDADTDTFRICAGDCDDTDSTVYPGAIELCDGKDNDCDDVVPSSEIDDDGDEISECQGDCDDTDGTVHPEADEVCDGKDNDCDGDTDEGCHACYWDADADGFGDPNDSKQFVITPEGYVTIAGDCDDTDGSVYPEADEVCDGKDNDCDGDTDEGCHTCYRDADEDGFGDPNDSIQSIDPPEGYVSIGGDCDDTDGSVYPEADEVCDGKDNDCDGVVDGESIIGCVQYYHDADGDGYGVIQHARCLCAPEDEYRARKPGDCDDSDPYKNPGAFDPCGGEDMNCDGITDCATLTGLVMDPNRPGVNPLLQGVRLTLTRVLPRSGAQHIIDPNGLVFDSSSQYYRYTVVDLEVGVYEARIDNVDEDPNTWRYQPARISLTLLPGETKARDISLVSIPAGEAPRSIAVLVSSPGEEVTLTLKELVMKDVRVEERTIERITKGHFEETVQVNGYESPGYGTLSDVSAYDTEVGMNPFEHTFVLFQDANCRIYAESKGYRRDIGDVLVTGDTPAQVELTIHEPGSPSLSVNSHDIDEGRISLTISYRDAFGRQGIWSYGKQPLADVKIAFFAPADDADGDGWPDPDRMPGGAHLTGSDMERTADPNDPQSITRLKYILDPRVHHMTVEQEAADAQGDPNIYVVAFTIELLDPEGGSLLGPLFRRLTVSPAEKRTVGQVFDTLDCSQVMSMGVIRVEGVLNANGEEKSATAFMDAASIDPAFLFEVPSGTAGQAVGPDAVLDLAITCAPDPLDPDVTVIDIALRNDEGTAVEYNPAGDPDAPPLILEIPLAGSLQAPDVEFWEATRRAVIKFIRFGSVEVFTPGDGEFIEFYISDKAVYMARIITRHTSGWYSTVPPENFFVTTEGLGAGEVAAGWDPVLDENMDLDEYRVYYGTSPDIDLTGGQYEPVPPGGNSCLISGLRDQTLYSFVLVAVSTSGDLGVSSPLVTAIPGAAYTGEELHEGTEVRDYQIVTYPVVAANPDPNAPENFLDDLGERDPQQWRLWWWDPSIDDYEEFPDIGTVVPCKAFFLIARNKGISIDIPGRPVQTSYAYELRSGWNLIGSPYPFDISWQEVLADPNNTDVIGRLYGGDPNDPFNDDPGVPKLYAFDSDSPSSYRYEDEVMEAGVGYWIRNTGDPAVLRFEPKIFLGSIEKRFRPVNISSESPPAPPGSETTPREQGIGGCFIGLFEENWHIAATAVILVILGVCALIGRRFRFPGKGGLGPFLLVLFLCGVSILLAVLCAESAGNVTTYIDARKAFQAGEYERAEKGFRGVIDVYPGHAYAHKDLGLTLIFMNRPNEALDALRKAFALAPRTRLALESQYAAGFLFLKSRKRLSQSVTLGYMYDDNVTLYPEEEPTGRYDAIGQIRYTPQLRWYIPGLRGFNTISVGYMIDSLFYDRRDERDLQIQLLIATWTYMRGTSRTTLLATYHSSHLDYDRYTNGPGIGFRWAHDFAYRMTAELGCGYDWQNRVQERTKDKETVKGLANVRFYSPGRGGYVQVEYVYRDDREKEGLTPVQKNELTSGTTHQYEICVSIPKSFILPFGFITAKGDWSAHRDVHSFTYSTKRYDWLYHMYLSGGHREDDTYVYEFRHTQPLFRNALSKKGGCRLDLELKYSHRHNDSNIDDLNPSLESRDYHRNTYALGLTCRF